MPVRDCGSIQKDKTPHFWGPKMNRIDHNKNNSNNNNNDNSFRVFLKKDQTTLSTAMAFIRQAETVRYPGQSRAF